MARANTPTLLSLDAWAKTMLLNPAHFNGGLAPNAHASEGGMMPLMGACSQVWWQYGWQAQDAASRETIAEQIAIAEEEIAGQLRYWPAPRWTVEEIHPYAQEYDVNWQRASVRTSWGKVIQGGKRGVSLVGTASTADGTLVYSDSRSYEFFDRATATLPTTMTNVQEIKAYFAGHAGDEAWEVRPARRRYLTGGNVIFEFDAWLLINPDLWEELPSGGGMTAIDLSDPDVYVTTLEIYREYADPTLPAVEFFWRDPCGVCGGNGCSVCATTSQTGCLALANGELGEVIPYASSYDTETETWQATGWAVNRRPDYVKISYLSGDRDDPYLRGRTTEPIRQTFIKAISYMATARLSGNLCGCDRTSKLVDWLQEDVSRLTQGASFFTPQELLNNPFGPKRGEVIAYRACRPAHLRGARVAVI